MNSIITLLVLVAVLSVVSPNRARQKSRDAKRISDIKQVQTALDIYAP